MKQAWNVFIIYAFFDTTQGVAMGAIRGSQQQKCGAIVTAIAFWLVGIPAALVLVFAYPYRIVGIWVGTALAVAVMTVAYVVNLSCMDWSKVVDKVNQ